MMVQKSLDTQISPTSPVPPSHKTATTTKHYSLSCIFYWILILISLLVSPIVYMVLTRAGLGRYFDAAFPNTTAPFTALPIISDQISEGETPLQVSDCVGVILYVLVSLKLLLQ